MRNIPGPISQYSRRDDNGEGDASTLVVEEEEDCEAMIAMNAWVALCQSVGVDTSSAEKMKGGIEDLMPCTIKSILAHDELRVPRLLALVVDSALTHAGIWLIKLVDCSGSYIQCFADAETVSSHDGLSSPGTALMIEDASLFLQQSTLERYLNLHERCISAVFPEVTENGVNVDDEAYLSD